jgi:hypothetical protein
VFFCISASSYVYLFIRIGILLKTKEVMSKLTRSYKMDLLIERYLKGEMESDEESRFLLQLQTDNELRKRAYLTAMIIASGNLQKAIKCS